LAAIWLERELDNNKGTGWMKVVPAARRPHAGVPKWRMRTRCRGSGGLGVWAGELENRRRERDDQAFRSKQAYPRSRTGARLSRPISHRCPSRQYWGRLRGAPSGGDRRPRSRASLRLGHPEALAPHDTRCSSPI